jgi:branched-chain amino acid aminotransferase
MYYTTCKINEKWSGGGLIPYGTIELSPAAGVLNYGQGVFEGTKAFRTGRNRVILFRPEMNARRMGLSTRRLCIPEMEEDFFLYAVKETVQDNLDYIPPQGKGSLYIRPIVWGTGPALGVKPANEYTFMVFVSPVGSYFKGGLKVLNLVLTEKYHRAAPKGIGNAKAIGNYSASLLPLTKAKESGFDDVIFLHSSNEKMVDEVSSANLFALKGNVLKTPRLGGSILPGVTRDSVIRIADEIMNLDVQETDLAIEEVLTADEVFCTGTAVVVTPVGNISFQGENHVIGTPGKGSVAKQLKNTLLNIQQEEIEDPFGWVTPISIL